MTKTRKLYRPYKSKTRSGYDCYVVYVPSSLSEILGLKNQVTTWQFRDKNEAIEFAKTQIRLAKLGI